MTVTLCRAISRAQANGLDLYQTYLASRLKPSDRTFYGQRQNLINQYRIAWNLTVFFLLMCRPWASSTRRWIFLSIFSLTRTCCMTRRCRSSPTSGLVQRRPIGSISTSPRRFRWSSLAPMGETNTYTRIEKNSFHSGNIDSEGTVSPEGHTLKTQYEALARYGVCIRSGSFHRHGRSRVKQYSLFSALDSG